MKKSIFLVLFFASMMQLSCTKEEVVVPNLKLEDLKGYYQLTYLQQNEQINTFPAAGYTGVFYMDVQVVNYITPTPRGALNQYYDYNYIESTLSIVYNGQSKYGLNPSFLEMKDITPNSCLLYIGNTKVGKFYIENGRKKVEFNMIDKQGNRVIFKAEN